ncbi:Tigger transposable element-derived protein 6 [Cucumispora dikerogammari]|nr:Tigger transposable element-derived protein 6 [Cucumispora dikerogammari]
MKRDDKVDLSSFMTILNQKRVEYTEENVYNLDKTGLFYKLIPFKTLCKKPSPSYKNFKDRVSIMLCSIFTETDKRAPFMIKKSVKPKCFRTFKISNTTKYSASKKAWMTSYLFNNWLLEFDDELDKNKKNFCY